VASQFVERINPVQAGKPLLGLNLVFAPNRALLAGQRPATIDVVNFCRHFTATSFFSFLNGDFRLKRITFIDPHKNGCILLQCL